MQIEIERLEQALIILSDAIEDGRIDGISNEIRDLLKYRPTVTEKTSKLLELIKQDDLLDETLDSFCLSGKISTVHADQIKQSLLLYKDKIENDFIDSLSTVSQLTHGADGLWRANGVAGKTVSEAITNYNNKIK